jgi:2-polyprenyl-3-methyl-5-hydroxy-6-metoxy-1,4-benzoquinol methylase
MTKSVCRICDHPKLKQVLSISKAPENVQRLLDERMFAGDRPIELRVFQCLQCGHVQLSEELENNYYEDYLMTHSHAKKMQEFQQKQATSFVDHFGLHGKKVFEAGAGDGQFAMVLTALGCEVVLNEPSVKARQACDQKGFTTVGGYVSEGSLSNLKGQFDAVVARQVLEHIPQPNDFAKGLRELLMPCGVGLIEVPSLEQAIENDRFFDFFPDHLSYFSANALTHLFTRNGFEVVDIFRSMDGEYHEAWIRRREYADFINLQDAVNNISDSFRAFLEKESVTGRRVAIWGAGAKGVLTLASVDVSSIVFLIDTDPIKHGRFTPVSHLQVHPPEILLGSNIDTVIITALAYKDEIINELKTQYAFKGKIACLAGGGIAEV